MLRGAYGVLSIVIFGTSVAVAQPTTGAGPCHEPDLSKQVECLNKEVGDLQAALRELKNQFVPWDQNVDIKAHLNNPAVPDRCLGPKNTSDAGPASFRADYCGTSPGGSFTIHKP
jgi:hypothetical protein